MPQLSSPIAKPVSRVVYHDEDFPTGWIGRPPQKWQDQPRAIRDFLVTKGFAAMNASQLQDWMEDRIKTDTCLGTTVVFSQDVLPATVAHAAAPSSMVRSYLDRGGRVVWLGDIPGWQQGHPKSAKPSPPWAELGPYAIFGLYPIFVHAPRDTIAPTRKARELGLFTSRWYGIRPMGTITGALRPLAKSQPGVPLEVRAMLPQLAIEPGKSLIGSAVQLVLNLRDLFAALAAVFAGIGLVALFAGGFPQISTFVLGAFAFFLAVIDAWLISETRRYRSLPSAWYKAFGTSRVGWMVRLWDYDPPVIDDKMLRDLGLIVEFRPNRR